MTTRTVLTLTRHEPGEEPVSRTYESPYPLTDRATFLSWVRDVTIAFMGEIEEDNS